MFNISETVRASEKNVWETFVDFDICYRIISLRKLGFVKIKTKKYIYLKRRGLVKDSLFNLNHYDILDSSAAFMMLNNVVKSLCLKNKFLSSANTIKFVNSDEFTISFINIIKSSGPNMESCGTPHFVASRLESAPFVLTY